VGVAVVLSLLGLGLLLLWVSRRVQSGTGLPSGRVLSQDTLGRRRASETLYDPVLDLAGRPDYLVAQAGQMIPVEVKSGRAHAGPRLSHKLQLAAYCRLVEAVYARRPAHGVLQYADRRYDIPFTAELEDEMADTIAAMRRSLGGELNRSHDSPERCRACGFRQGCDQALA
jgi:CRISPR/Cas system-associated exonuclease Cas4 (RecB family)